MSNGTSLGDLVLNGSSGAGLIAAITSYATWISITLTAIGVFAGIVFKILERRDRKLRLKMDQDRLAHDIKNDTHGIIIDKEDYNNKKE